MNQIHALNEEMNTILYVETLYLLSGIVSVFHWSSPQISSVLFQCLASAMQTSL
jgi:hypothetical protein